MAKRQTETHFKIERNLKMNFFCEFFGNYFSSENLDTNGQNSEVSQIVTDDEQLVTVKTMESIATEGVLSTVVERCNSIVASLRSSVSDQGPLSNLVGGSFTKTMSTTEAPRHRAFSATTAESTSKLRESNDEANCIGSYGFVIPRRTRNRAESSGTRHHQAHGSDSGTVGNREETMNLRRCRATNKLNTSEGTLGSRSTSRSSYGSLVSVEEKGLKSIIDMPSLNEEEEECDTSSSGLKLKKTSFIHKVRDTLKNLEQNIVLRHRRYKKRAKRDQLTDYYRQKYNTDAQESLNATRLKEETPTNEKSKRVSRLFDCVRNKFTAKPNSRTDAAHKRVSIKMEKRKQLFQGRSRGEIVAHIQKKYSKAS